MPFGNAGSMRGSGIDWHGRARDYYNNIVGILNAQVYTQSDLENIHHYLKELYRDYWVMGRLYNFLDYQSFNVDLPHYEREIKEIDSVAPAENQAENTVMVSASHSTAKMKQRLQESEQGMEMTTFYDQQKSEVAKNNIKYLLNADLINLTMEFMDDNTIAKAARGVCKKWNECSETVVVKNRFVFFNRLVVMNISKLPQAPTFGELRQAARERDQHPDKSSLTVLENVVARR